MGLGVTLSNALSGMRTSQASLEVLSRNVANAGTPGYHRQSINVIDTKGANSVYARSGGIERAFNNSLQAHYTGAISDAGFASVRAGILDRLQAALGKPGETGSLNSTFSALQNALQALGTSPDSYATRQTVVTQAQAMVATLNTLTRDVQSLRQETEAQMSATVDVLNQQLSSLQQINLRLGDQSGDGASRAALLDQRDRLVSQIAEMIDVRVDYRPDDTVALMTRTGVGLVDGKVSTFSFQAVGAITPESRFSSDSNKSAVGQLLLTTSSGTTIDLVKQNVLQSGRLAALMELRDNSLVAAQGQLDEIAAGLATAFSTVTTAGMPAQSGSQNGFSIDLAPIRDGNDVVIDYTVGGVQKSVRAVNVTDSTKLPLDYQDANGVRVVGMNFAAGAAGVASALTPILGASVTTSGTGTTLTVLDDGAGNGSDIRAVTRHSTSTGLQDGSPALSLFVDRGQGDFTNSLSGKGQKLGFAGRISVNSDILSDNTLLVRQLPGGSLGDATRPNYLLDQLDTMRFASSQLGPAPGGTFRLGGTLNDMIAQTMNFSGNMAAAAISDADTQALTLETLTQRLDAEYGVNVDEEMARLMALQNAYAANSRVIGVVQDLLNRLMDL